MLVELRVRDFALIEDLSLSLGPGFSVLTGETGAGKSIIVDALIAALGERVGNEVVRTGADASVVEAIFDVADSPNAVQVARNHGFEPDDDLLILTREIARNGRSACRINGRAATASVCREITSALVDVHGQHEHQSLLAVGSHLDSLDAWIGDRAAELRTEAGAVFAELDALREERRRLQLDERERARLLDLYKFQVDEIDSARLAVDEEDELAAEKTRLANAEKLFQSASEAYELLSGDRGAVDGLSAAARSAERVAALDESMSGFLEAVQAALFAAQEAASSARDYMDRIEADPSRLEHVEERLDLIRTLKKKYGDTIEEVIAYSRDLTAKIEELSHAEERSEHLEERLHNLEERLADVCRKLTSARKKAACEFARAVESELSELAMERTRFEVGFDRTEPGPKGADSVEFLISPNPGEPVKPLAKIASGGEMSRIMLALKTVLARAQVPALVFDEIDAGIGGVTAQVLGEKLARLALDCQVMCVTHLPQIASRASRHVRVDKVVRDGRSVVEVSVLTDEERVAELARMLGSREASAAAAEHAREMLSLAGNGNSQAR